MSEWQSRIIGLEYKPANQFLANVKNPRRHPARQRSALRGSLDTLGWYDVVIENQQTGELIDGHARIEEALSKDENALVPVLVVDLAPHEQDLALASHDFISYMAEYDRDSLDSLLHDVNTDNEGLLASLSELAESHDLYFGDAPSIPEAPEAQMDRAEELQKEWQVKRGDLWIIPSKSGNGVHRLLCGDSTKAEDVARVMEKEKAELLATDPPYNVSIDYGDNSNDEKSDNEYELFSVAWFYTWQKFSVRQCVTTGYNNLWSWMRFFEKPYHVGAWTKTNSMTRGHVSQWAAFEPIVFYGDRWKRIRHSDVYNFPISSQTTQDGDTLTDLHPCPKPLSMWLDIIENYTEVNEIIGEPFGGSGTTMVACEQLSRQCRMIEIEAKYCSVILERMSQMGLELYLEENNG